MGIFLKTLKIRFSINYVADVRLVPFTKIASCRGFFVVGTSLSPRTERNLDGLTRQPPIYKLVENLQAQEELGIG